MKEKLLFVCLTCQMTDAIHIEGNETVKEVIALMASEHKKSMPRCKSEGKYRLVLKDGEAQHRVQPTPPPALICECGSLYGVHEEFCPKYKSAGG